MGASLIILPIVLQNSQVLKRGLRFLDMYNEEGNLSAQDRVLASVFGTHAVDLIAQGKFDRMVAWQNRHVVDVSIQQAIAGYQAVDINGSLVKTARGLGICFGDENF